MKNLKTNHYLGLFVSLSCYLLSLIAEGSTRLFLLQNENFTSHKFAVLSSNLNMVLTSLFAVLIIVGMFTVIYHIRIIFNCGIPINKIVHAITQTVVVYIIFQVIKIIIHFFYLSDFRKKEIDPNNLIDVIIESDWYFAVSSVNIIMYLSGLAAFFFTLFEKRAEDHKDVFYLSLGKSMCVMAIIYNL